MVPYEDWIELCNVAGKHAWICIPALASDDFIRRMAALFDSQLRPDLGIYVEYSNEVWNWAMPQYGQLEAERAADGYPLEPWEYVARRDGHATNLFKASLPPGRRCTRVLARQAGYPATLTVAMQQYAADGHGFDMIATAAYFAPGVDYDGLTGVYATDPGRAVTAVLDACDAAILDVAGQVAWYQKQADLAGVPLGLYELGQHMVNWPNDASTPMLAQANRDPRMVAKYNLLVKSLPAGVGPACWFFDAGGYSKWGYWGLKEYTDQPVSAAPKWRAVLDARRLGVLTPPVGTAP
jgi:hypothetical protein